MLMLTVTMTVSFSAWGSPQAQRGAQATEPSWHCSQQAVDQEQAHQHTAAKSHPLLHSASIDDDRAELDVMHALLVPTLLPDTHPPLASALDPADNWPGLPLRPPRH
jgi:hypothetical protein